MKKLSINLLVALFVVLAVSGCKKVLDKSPFNAITDDVAFATSDRCLLALNGVYDAAQTGNFAGRGYPFGAASIQQNEARGEDVINIQAFYQITYQATYNATTANNNQQWENLYALINKANLSIAGFKNAGTGGVITSAVAAQYEAECRFLRAMAHHEAVVFYARPFLDGAGNKIGIIYRDFAINSSSTVEEAKKVPRGTVAENYQKILADLDFAETNLPATVTPSTFRATKAAAIVLKMRVKLHMGDWAGAIAEGNKVIPAGSGPYTSPIGGWNLTASPDGPFVGFTSTESIFSIKHDALDHASVNGDLSTMLGPANLGARGLVTISPVIFNNTGWLCDDRRRTLLTVSGTNANGATTFSIFTSKYRSYTNRDGSAPHIRYAEALLVQAEAEARLASGVSARALTLLNAVRNRSLALPGTQAYTLASFADKNALIGAILLERRIEFASEGKRWHDIHRNAVDPNFSTGGIPAKYNNAAQGAGIFGCGTAILTPQSAIPYADFRFLWPIPASEVIQNPIVVQNPGY